VARRRATRWPTCCANPDIVYGEGINVGYKGYDVAGIQPLFPFGYGLSYTGFGYRDLSVQTPNVHAARLGDVHIRFRITNTGGRSGTETAQVYLGLPTSTGEPPKRLVGYAQVTLDAGKSKMVHITIDPRASTHPLSYFDQTLGQWRITPGTYRVYVGTSVSSSTPRRAVIGCSGAWGR